MKDFKHISEYEKIFDEVKNAQEILENAIENYKSLQSKVQILEKYYSSSQWKEDFAMDERDEIPAYVKRGVLSEDGIYNMLARNREIMEMINRDGGEMRKNSFICITI